MLNGWGIVDKASVVMHSLEPRIPHYYLNGISLCQEFYWVGYDLILNKPKDACQECEERKQRLDNTCCNEGYCRGCNGVGCSGCKYTGECQECKGEKNEIRT